jgi:Domain of unknown function (DUF4377)
MLLWMGRRSIAMAVVAVLLVACAREPAGIAERWWVQHYKAPCVGEGPRLCYLVDRGAGDFEYFYDEIEGFEYRWGFSHAIEVSSSTQPAMADASTLRHRLVSVIEQRRAPPDATFNLPVSLEGQVLIEGDAGACTLLGAIAIDTSESSCDALRSREAVVFRHHGSEPKLVPSAGSP